MFDDTPDNLPTGDGHKEAPASPPAPAPATGGTLSMPEPAEPPPAAEPEDMFGDLDSGDVPAPSMPAAAPVPGAPPAPGKAPKVKKGGGGMKKILLIVVIVIVAILAVVGGVFAYRSLSSAPIDDILNEDTTPVRTTPTPSTTTPTNTVTVPTDGSPVDTMPEDKTPPVRVLDSDGDGLSDAEEAAAGTSSRKPDTDNDGLFDREEVQVYGTDPLNPDTDGDGFIDGEEVSGGYNPNGEGRLIEVPTE